MGDSGITEDIVTKALKAGTGRTFMREMKAIRASGFRGPDRQRFAVPPNVNFSRDDKRYYLPYLKARFKKEFLEGSAYLVKYQDPRWWPPYFGMTLAGLEKATPEGVQSILDNNKKILQIPRDVISDVVADLASSSIKIADNWSVESNVTDEIPHEDIASPLFDGLQNNIETVWMHSTQNYGMYELITEKMANNPSLKRFRISCHKDEIPQNAITFNSKYIWDVEVKANRFEPGFSIILPNAEGPVEVTLIAHEIDEETVDELMEALSKLRQKVTVTIRRFSQSGRGRVRGESIFLKNFLGIDEEKIQKEGNERGWEKYSAKYMIGGEDYDLTEYSDTSTLDTMVKYTLN